VDVLKALAGRALQPLNQWIARRRHQKVIGNYLAHVRALAEADAGSAALPGENGDLALSLVIPTYNTPARYLTDLVRSFNAQNCPLAELVFSDDGSTEPETLSLLESFRSPRIQVVLNGSNGGIAAATNAGIGAARGEWVAFLDHDDAIFPHALNRILATLRQNPACRFLYTDEIITDGNLKPVDVFFKPGWDPVLLSGVNYINHFSCYRRERLVEIGQLRLGFDGSQDYDLLLRYTKDLAPGEILHLPYPAYLWRRDGGSFTAHSMDRATAHARKALGDHYAREGEPMPVGPAKIESLHRVRFDEARKEWPFVSIVIPNHEFPHLLRKALDGVLTGTDYPAFEVIIIDHGSKSPELHALYAEVQERFANVSVHIKPETFNFSRMINRGVSMARGSVFLLLNSDVEIVEPGWLKEMVSCLDYPDAGIVGAKLLFPDRTIQHAGVIAGYGGLAGHWFMFKPEDFPGPMGRLAVRQGLTVVTGACLLVSRECWERIGPLDEQLFAVAYNDVDFCLRAHKAGYRIIWSPFAMLLHHESAVRGSDEAPDKIERFRREQANLRAAHATDVFLDPALSPWYTNDRTSPEIRLLKTLPEAR
jgi:O-antigen biosynthesis protein